LYHSNIEEKVIPKLVEEAPSPVMTPVRKRKGTKNTATAND
jgi:acetyl/propionyl-CoA carboxylase alpha subunit